jgi:hypothetical protein
MNIRKIAVRSVTAAAFTIGTAMGGLGSAAAAPGDYSTLPVDPNLVTDSQAYSTAPLVVNPNGQPGVTAVYNHRNGGMQITNTILILPDAAGVSAALGGLDAAAKVAGGQTQPASVGTGGTMVSGMSPDGSKSVTVLTFTRGNAAAMLEFDGPPKDPAPADLVTELGQKQDTAIRDWQAT